MFFNHVADKDIHKMSSCVVCQGLGSSILLYYIFSASILLQSLLDYL